jgi:hypothetical protein
MDPTDQDEEEGANVDLDAQRKGKCAVVKTSTRQVFIADNHCNGFLVCVLGGIRYAAGRRILLCQSRLELDALLTNSAFILCSNTL